MEKVEKDRLACIYNIAPAAGGSGELDQRLHVPYDWEWRAAKFVPVPDGVDVKREMSARAAAVKKARRAAR
jgi:hypothetical protein